ncbi:MAG: ADP-ribose pyrophosphatase, partial [Rhodospirillaceae bacterium]|nr:ADP-ribose pyrophosphatase [Rhodospirillaceae bacterium]
RHTLHNGGMSNVISREVFERGQAGAVLLYDPRRDEVVLIRQFRAGAYVAGRHPWTWEIVAGIIEHDESPEELIRREAIEEAGLQIRDVIPMHDVVVSPGACSETCASFLGRVDTTNAGGIHGLESEGENILVKVLPFAEARAMLDRDEIGNALGVIALQWLALHRDEVRARWR